MSTFQDEVYNLAHIWCSLWACFIVKIRSSHDVFYGFKNSRDLKIWESYEQWKKWPKTPENMTIILSCVNGVTL